MCVLGDAVEYFGGSQSYRTLAVSQKRRKGGKILLYAALLSLLVSRELLDLVTEQADDEIVFPPEQLDESVPRVPRRESKELLKSSISDSLSKAC
ncbi:hypothetical protein C8039_20080 [Halogeometricum sp. wsp3]|nr:hypothetical protein C8039_20080 [Halogeometricum sp. wsp3]